MKTGTREIMVPCRVHLAVRLAVASFLICSNIAVADVVLVHGQWGEWGDWGECSATCGETMTRYRKCDSPKPEHGGDDCTGDHMEVAWCNDRKNCPMHGQWGEWGDWGECSATCGETMTRYRKCDSPKPEHGGDDCTGDHMKVAWCNDRKNCPINGGWRSWSAWSPCSATCGRKGTKYRYRSCTAPEPGYGGQDCEGDVNAHRTCFSSRKCPIDGGWGEWKDWHCPEECKQDDEKGVAWRNRFCSEPSPKYGGNQCKGESMQRAHCSNATCAVNGGWGEWSSFSECSSSCGDNGFKSQTRQCNNPRPEFGGYKCTGSKTHSISCGNDPCEYDSEENSQFPGSDQISEGGGAPPDDEDLGLPEEGSGSEKVASGDGNIEDEPSSDLVPEYEDN